MNQRLGESPRDSKGPQPGDRQPAAHNSVHRAASICSAGGWVKAPAATLWAWVTNFPLSHERAQAIANQGGRARNGIENVFNIQMQVAYTIDQLLVHGLLRRLTRACRKVADSQPIELLRASLLTVRIDPAPSGLRPTTFLLDRLTSRTAGPPRPNPPAFKDSLLTDACSDHPPLP